MARFQPLRLLVVGYILVVALMGCSLVQPKVAGPAAPCTVSSSKQAAERFLQRIQSQTKTTGKTITITATSQEVTSVIRESIQLAKSADLSSSVPLDDMVVCFNPGKMTLYGQVNAAGVKSSAVIAVNAAVDHGKASFLVNRVELGPLAVPQDLGAAVSQLVTDAFNQNIVQIDLTEIRIQEGQITLSGRSR